jgi:hypothetical protein
VVTFGSYRSFFSEIRADHRDEGLNVEFRPRPI